MVSLNKFKTHHNNVYLGHPHQFWRLRHRRDMETLINVADLKTSLDKVSYDALHLQKAIINRTSEKVSKLLNQEEIRL
ncbi:unnamed protein product [Pieris macdunnoughi]|uniref:Uncharacterized protein n=1 Tax=Pieris macdunnoughi TaxID=345717 RepID=A0A821MNJ9_9NEOP|nr:unnamed protein product [Pieris macdunnoughi]